MRWARWCLTLVGTAAVLTGAGCTDRGGRDAVAHASLMLTEAQILDAVPTAERAGPDQVSSDDLLLVECSSVLQQAWSIPSVAPAPPVDAGSIINAVVSCETEAAAQECPEQLVGDIPDRVDFPVPDAVEVRRTTDPDGGTSYVAVTSRGARCMVVSLDLTEPPSDASDTQFQRLTGALDDLAAHG